MLITDMPNMPDKVMSKITLVYFTLGWNEKDKQHVGEELSDVLVYLVRLAELCEVDLPNAVLRKLELNAKKYPADMVHGSQPTRRKS